MDIIQTVSLNLLSNVVAMQEQELIAVRIKDGIFAGNIAAAEDREFLGMNKITHIINCAGGEVADYFVGDPELKYLSFPWKDTGSVCTTVLFDLADDNIKKTVAFIDEATADGNCVLVHSVYGVSRSAALIAAYFIVKYGWKLESALSFLEMAHPDVSIKPHFLRQLRTFAKKHQVAHDIFDKSVDDATFGLDNDQWMLRNTLLNGLAYEEQQANELFKQCSTKIDVGERKGKKRAGHLTFIDTNKGTGIDSMNTNPVVNVNPVHHMDPNSSSPGFVGSQGPVALRSGKRSPSILSRSSSPCSYRLESDPKSCPKGRQELPLLPSSDSAAPEMRQITSSTRISLDRSSQKPIDNIPVTVRPAASKENEDRATTKQETPNDAAHAASHSDYARLAPPVHRSQFALKPGGKMRNGSPLPLQGKKKTTKRKSSPAARSSSANNSPRSSSAKAKSPRGTPPSSAAAPTVGTSKTIVRNSSSSYKGIAPSRTIPPPPDSATSTSKTPAPAARTGSVRTKSRTSSPKTGPKSRTSSPAADAKGSSRLTKTSSTSSLNSATDNNSPSRRTINSTSTGAPNTVRRQPPAVITSRRKIS